MPLDVIVGAQWGDEGKGRITDALAAQAAVVARYGGGDNAGHTVTVGDRIFKLHLIPSGIIHPHTLCLLGAGMVVNPIVLAREIDELKALGVAAGPDRLRLAYNAHLITPLHQATDAAEERRRGGPGLGTTRRGIGPAYTDKAARRGLRAEQMRDSDAFAREVQAQMETGGAAFRQLYGLEPPDPVETAQQYGELAERLGAYVDDPGRLIHAALERGETVLAEGAQGTLLDLDHGSYPYVTSSHPSAPAALTGLGVGPKYLRRILGVTKAFQTRVGEGPFPTELQGPIAEQLRGTGEQPWDEFGTTTGRPRRCGWLDGVLLRYAVRVNGLTELALTKLDVLGGLETLHIASTYAGEGSEFTEPPAGPAALTAVEPQYETLPGWQDDLMAIRDWDSLPEAARSYVRRVETIAAVPIRLISVGPEREQLVDRGIAG